MASDIIKRLPKTFFFAMMLLGTICLISACGAQSEPNPEQDTLDASSLLMSDMLSERSSDIVSSGGDSYFAITEEKELLSWGDIDIPLGQSSYPTAENPQFIMENAIFVSSSQTVTLIIDSDGVLWGYGTNTYGQLGPNSADTNEPVEILDHVTQARAGSRHCLALRTDGSLWVWGFNDFGQLGIGSADTDENVRTVHPPVKIMSDISAIEASYYDSYAIDTNGGLWAWGVLGNENDPVLSPVKICDSIIQVAASNTQFYCLRKDNNLCTVTFEKLHESIKDSAQIDWTPLLSHIVFVTRDAAIQDSGQLYIWSEESDTDTPVPAMDHIAFAAWSSHYILAVSESHELWQIDVEKLTGTAK